MGIGGRGYDPWLCRCLNKLFRLGFASRGDGFSTWQRSVMRGSVRWLGFGQGAILSYIMCKGMTVVSYSVILGAALVAHLWVHRWQFEGELDLRSKVDGGRQCEREPIAISHHPRIYGEMAGVAQATAKRSASMVKSCGPRAKNVRFAIHPVAARICRVTMKCAGRGAKVPMDIVMEMGRASND